MDMIKNIPVHMDYVGQGRAEKLYQVIFENFITNDNCVANCLLKINILSPLIFVCQIIIVLFGVVGLGWGYTIQQFSQTVRM